MYEKPTVETSEPMVVIELSRGLRGIVIAELRPGLDFIYSVCILYLSIDLSTAPSLPFLDESNSVSSSAI